MTVTLKYYDYDAFGVEKAPEELDANPFRYCGEYWDAETETVYLRNRHYNPRLGRFTAVDPAKDGLNWYTYCGNNPLRFVDPLGLAREQLDRTPARNMKALKSKSKSSVVNKIETKDITSALVRGLIISPTLTYATQQGWASDVFNAAGFIRDSDGIYHARQDAWQQHVGFNDFYDIVFDYSTSMDNAKFEFRHDEKDYIFWAWKGDYINFGAGAEMGIYTRFSSTNHWLVDTDLALPMTLTLNDNKGNQILSYSPIEKQWWITGFNRKRQIVGPIDGKSRP